MKLSRILLIGSLFGVLGVGWWMAAPSGVMADLYDPNRIRSLIDDAGLYGPFLVIAIMAIAIVFSPLPSAPIALAAGAAYGHTWGTIYILIGAEAGALIAFMIARFCGREFVNRHLGEKLPKTKINTQNGLTAIVFVTRLLPFLSFDAVSYAAGLTKLTTIRFAAATLAGMVPASFLLAHFGAEAMSGDFGTAEWIIIGLGLMTAAPLLVAALWRTNRSTNAS